MSLTLYNSDIKKDYIQDIKEKEFEKKSSVIPPESINIFLKYFSHSNLNQFYTFLLVDKKWKKSVYKNQRFLCEKILHELKLPKWDKKGTMINLVQSTKLMMSERFNEIFPMAYLKTSFKNELNDLIANGNINKKILNGFQEIYKARDTLVVWYLLERDLTEQKTEIIIFKDIFANINSVKELIEKSREFANYLTHQKRLQFKSDFNLSSANLYSLPAEIFQLKNLKMLNLSSNKLTFLPPQIGQLKNLERLYLSNNQLTSLPDEFWTLNHLQELNLSTNQLNTPAIIEIFRFKNLKILNLADNKLTFFPPNSDQLKKLESPYLSDNQLTLLPDEFWLLNNLEKLDLAKNQLDENAIAEIFRFKNLKVLNLYYNKLTFLPSNIEQLKHLEKLYLSNNQLTLLTDEFWTLNHLQELDLSKNQLNMISEKIESLTKLRHIIMTGNPLNSLPKILDEMELNGLFVTVEETKKNMYKDASDNTSDCCVIQ